MAKGKGELSPVEQELQDVQSGSWEENIPLPPENIANCDTKILHVSEE